MLRNRPLKIITNLPRVHMHTTCIKRIAYCSASKHLNSNRYFTLFNIFSQYDKLPYFSTLLCTFNNGTKHFPFQFLRNLTNLIIPSKFLNPQIQKNTHHKHYTHRYISKKTATRFLLFFFLLPRRFQINLSLFPSFT